MKIQENVSLKNFNTFKIDTKAKFLFEIEDLNELIGNIKNFKNEKILVLGGGSNTLLVNDWNGIVLRPVFQGKEVIKETDEYVEIKVASGENWDDFVKWCVEKDYAGVENLVLIPGTVGGAVAQNIAAYGQNITDTLIGIEAIKLDSMEKVTLKPSECGYEYRRSNFKKVWRNKFLITSVTFKLKKNTIEFELSYHERAGRYGSIMEELQSFAKEPFSIQDVMEAIVRQRNKRLPSIDEWGTCGSFFENPIVTRENIMSYQK